MLPIGTVVVLTDQRPPVEIPERVDPDNPERTRPAHTLPYPYNRSVVSAMLDCGEAGQELVLTPLSSHAEPLVIAPSMILRAGFEVDEAATREHAAAIGAAAAPTPHVGAAPPWETPASDLTETKA